ncbi:ribonuclease I [Salinisphaera sp. Q1T1-3]|uniref:ribonuclease T2 family protein n=1 Tax=Salinisphaera sp. Q1T1-3 TaxID=2321229 RepID=UPI000E716032|nr:ribonuclease I [Salinisphaera sp. Q1T1-3]RJS91044.1 ribonuclease I [Salinisphaera sp. Q1T1-3]
MKKTRASILAGFVLVWLSGTASAATVGNDMPSLMPGRLGDFGHYTLALTWQPGFCDGDSCAADQPRDVLIGLHGLWPSRPQDLIQRDIAAPQWWSRGCDYYHHSGAAPTLDADTRRSLARIMPQLDSDLLTHEYDKHVQCFDYVADDFFDAALVLRGRIADSPFGRWLQEHAEQSVARHDLLAAFDRAFDTQKTAALQLRCSGDGDNRFLSQLWFTIPREHLADFPQEAGLMNAPIAQHNCPARFRVPNWS